MYNGHAYNNPWGEDIMRLHSCPSRGPDCACVARCKSNDIHIQVDINHFRRSQHGVRHDTSVAMPRRVSLHKQLYRVNMFNMFLGKRVLKCYMSPLFILNVQVSNTFRMCGSAARQLMVGMNCLIAIFMPCVRMIYIKWKYMIINDVTIR